MWYSCNGCGWCKAHTCSYWKTSNRAWRNKGKPELVDMCCNGSIVLITLPAGAVVKYCDEYVCLCVCLSVCEDIPGTTCTIFTKFFVRVAYVRGSISSSGIFCCFLFDVVYHIWWIKDFHIDDRPHRLSAGRGDGSAQRGRSVICDCLVINYGYN